MNRRINSLLFLVCIFSSFVFAKITRAEIITDAATKSKNQYIVYSVTDQNLGATSSDEIDTDGDGYSDQKEIKNNYSPYNSKAVKLDKNDADKDGLNDSLELKFKTDPLNPDSDSDGYKDGEVVYWGYNPLSSSTKKLSQQIIINLKTQKLK